MKSFEEKGLPNLSLTHTLLQSVGRLREYRGREQLYAQQARQALDTLKEVAVIRSAESSNRIEGVEAVPERIKKLMMESTAPEARSEQAIAGCRDVLSTIHTHHEDIAFSPDLVRQFHRDLLKYTRRRGRAIAPCNEDRFYVASEQADNTPTPTYAHTVAAQRGGGH